MRRARKCAEGNFTNQRVGRDSSVPAYSTSSRTRDVVPTSSDWRTTFSTVAVVCAPANSVITACAQSTVRPSGPETHPTLLAASFLPLSKRRQPTIDKQAGARDKDASSDARKQIAADLIGRSGRFKRVRAKPFAILVIGLPQFAPGQREKCKDWPGSDRDTPRDRVPSTASVPEWLLWWCRTARSSIRR